MYTQIFPNPSLPPCCVFGDLRSTMVALVQASMATRYVKDAMDIAGAWFLHIKRSICITHLK